MRSRELSSMELSPLVFLSLRRLCFVTGAASGPGRLSDVGPWKSFISPPRSNLPEISDV